MIFIQGVKGVTMSMTWLFLTLVWQLSLTCQHCHIILTSTHTHYNINQEWPTHNINYNLVKISKIDTSVSSKLKVGIGHHRMKWNSYFDPKSDRLKFKILKSHEVGIISAQQLPFKLQTNDKCQGYIQNNVEYT